MYLMMSQICERALNDTFAAGKAILKFISANDVSLTGSHQSGFYLPKAISSVYSPFPATKGQNNDHPVTVLWQDGRTTASMVKWYGNKTRSEYRLTRFGRNFPWLRNEYLASLLVLIPKTISEFQGYVLQEEDDIVEFQAALGLEVIGSWSLYDKHGDFHETENECLDRTFRSFVTTLNSFPSVRIFSDTTHKAVISCISHFPSLSIDDQIVELIKDEYQLFQMAQLKLFGPRISQPFESIEQFLAVAQTILQARKSRAGRSLENHVEDLLRAAGIPFDIRTVVDDTRPDIIIPGKTEYNDPDFPTKRLFMVGVKTTCKDRWRQVLNEAPRVRKKHILTLQKGITSPQLKEIRNSEVTLVVPAPLHKEYPKDFRKHLLTLEGFIQTVRHSLAV